VLSKAAKSVELRDAPLIEALLLSGRGQASIGVTLLDWRVPTPEPSTLNVTVIGVPNQITTVTAVRSRADSFSRHGDDVHFRLTAFSGFDVVHLT
jgi:hypothetical protein